jgi:hypothetical protein
VDFRKSWSWFAEKISICRRLIEFGMKILLRSQATKLYYAGDDQWKPEPENAVPFPSSLNAWNIVMRESMDENLELVYAFENPEENLSVPIDPSCVWPLYS